MPEKQKTTLKKTLIYGWVQEKTGKMIRPVYILFYVDADKSQTWASEIHLVRSLEQLEISLFRCDPASRDVEMTRAVIANSPLPEKSDEPAQYITGDTARLIHASIALAEGQAEKYQNLQLEFESYKKQTDPDGAFAFIRRWFKDKSEQ